MAFLTIRDQEQGVSFLYTVLFHIWQLKILSVHTSGNTSSHIILASFANFAKFMIKHKL